MSVGTTTPHTHWCPHCEAMKDCATARKDEVGCIFASTSPITCHECEWRSFDEGARVGEQMSLTLEATP